MQTSQIIQILLILIELSWVFYVANKTCNKYVAISETKLPSDNYPLNSYLMWTVILCSLTAAILVSITWFLFN